MLAAVLQRVHEVGSKSGEKAEALARAFTPTRNVPAHRQFVIDGEAVVLGVNGISDFDAVPIENSDSTILMMQSAKNTVGGNAAVELNCTRDWSILVRR